MASKRPAAFFIDATTVSLIFLYSVTAARAQSVDELRHLSLEALGDVNVSSVLKREGKLSEAPASIYVISQADIARSG